MSYETIHPGDNKQSVPLALATFYQSTSAALERLDGSSFLKLVNIWWTINNSKQEFNTNFQIGNAAVKNDKKNLCFYENLRIGWRIIKDCRAKIVLRPLLKIV